MTCSKSVSKLSDLKESTVGWHTIFNSSFVVQINANIVKTLATAVAQHCPNVSDIPIICVLFC